MFENNFKEQGRSLKKSLFAVSLPTHLYSPYPTHFMALLGNYYSFFVLLLSKISRFFLLRSNVRQCMQKYFPAYLPIQKYRVGVLQILNLKNDPLLENVVNYFQSIRKHDTPGSDTFSFRSCCWGISVWRLDIFPYKTFCLMLIFITFTVGFEPTYVTGTVAPDNSLHRHAQHVNVKCTNLLSF